MTKEVSATISNGAEFLLMHHLFKADHHNYEVINQTFSELSFSWFAGYSARAILRGLDVLTKLGYVEDHRLEEAIDIILRARSAEATKQWSLGFGEFSQGKNANRHRKKRPTQ